MKQLTIFDYMQPSNQKSIEGKSLDEIAAIVSMQLGLDFKPRTWEYDGIEHKVFEAVISKGKVFELREGFYSTQGLNDYFDKRYGKRYIGVGYKFKPYSGGGAPCDDIDQVVNYFRAVLSGEN